jgi:hypothetical protein
MFLCKVFVEQKMKQEIAKNDYYEFYVDQSKNRYYSKLIGFWEKASDVPDFISDHRKALELLSPGFTILVDNREYKTPVQECMELHIKIIGMSNEAEVGKIALVESQAVVKIAGGRVMREGGMEETSRQFNDIKEAEDWLDGKYV